MLQTDYQTLLRIGRSMISERNVDKLCELILNEAQKLSRADGGTLYLVNAQPASELHYSMPMTTLSLIFQGPNSLIKPITIAPNLF